MRTLAVLSLCVLELSCYRGGGVADCAVQCSGDRDCPLGSTCDPSAGLCTSGLSCTGLGPDADATAPDAPGPTAAWRAVDVGGRFVCAISGAGRLYCWGDNRRGQLGGQPSDPVPAPREVRVVGSANGEVLDRWIAVSAGDDYACAIAALPDPAPADQGLLYCWGANDFAQAGGDPQFDVARPVVPVDAVKTNWRTVTAATGGTHTCAIDATDTAYCWGSNTVGKVAPARFASAIVPYVMASTWPQTRAIAGGPRATCRLNDRDLVTCWGASAGEFGLASCPEVIGTAICDEFAPVSPPVAATQVTLGVGHGCQSGSQPGSTWCWGDNTFGQEGDALDSQAPRLTELSFVAGLVATPNATCGVRADGKAACAGSNRWGELGDDRPLDTRRRRVAGLPSLSVGPVVRQISAGGIGNYDPARASATVCTIDEGGALRCWGNNDHGQLGRGVVGSHPQPVEVVVTRAVGDGWADLAVGATHTCATLGSAAGGPRQVLCWGGNERLQVGVDSLLATSTPQVVVPPAGRGAVDHSYGALSASRDHTCYTAVGDRVVCWGDRSSAQFSASGVNLPQALPVLDDTLIGTQLAVGDAHTCVATPANPLARPGACAPTVAEVAPCFPAAGQDGRGATILADGLIAVTNPSSGNTPLCSPTACDGGGNCAGQGGGISGVELGDRHTCGLLAGDLFCWGDRGTMDGSDGFGTVRIMPSVGASFVGVTVGRATTCAATSAGAVRCFGANQTSQVGLPPRDSAVRFGDADNQAPLQLPADVCATPMLGLAERHGCVITVPRNGDQTCPVVASVAFAERRLFCWGSNSHGQLGPAAAASAGGAVPALVLDPPPPS